MDNKNFKNRVILAKNEENNFLFISLNLFILIFFIALISYRSVEKNSLKDVFLSFKNYKSKELIIQTHSDRSLEQAKKIYLEILNPLVEKPLALDLVDLYDNIILKLHFDFNDLYFPSNKLKPFAMQVINLISTRHNYLSNYNLKAEVIFNLSNLDSDDYMEKAVELMSNLSKDNIDVVFNFNSYDNFDQKIIVRFKIEEELIKD